MSGYLVLFYVAAMSALDLRTRKISWIVSGVAIVAVLGLWWWNRPITLLNLLGGVSLGILMLGVSWITKNAVGMGDGIVLIIIGLGVGGMTALSVLAGGLLLAGLYAGVLLLFKKVNRNDEIPFVPFLFLAYGGILWYG